MGQFCSLVFQIFQNFCLCLCSLFVLFPVKLVLMNESFKMLSSMSPKCKNKQKTVSKAIKVLALNRHLRKSSVYRNVPTVSNEDLILVDGSTSSSVSSKSNRDVVGSKVHDVIVLDSSSDNELDEIKEVGPLYDNTSKTSRIHKWLASVEADDKGNLTSFSQVSTIYGDVALNDNGCAVQSTFIDPATRRFDELFKSNSAHVNKETDASFEFDFDKSFRSKLVPKLKQNVEKYEAKDQDFTPQSMNKTKEKFVTLRNKDKRINFGDACEPIHTETESLLDTLYGTKWRDKKEQVIPQTEPRKNNHGSTRILENKAATDKKIVNSKIKNLQRENKSPWMDKFKQICDSDTDSDDLNFGNRVNVRVRLEFDSECDSEKNSRKQNNGKIRVPPLEDVIQNRLNKIVPTSEPKFSTKINKKCNTKKTDNDKGRIKNKKLKDKENIKPTRDTTGNVSSDNKMNFKSNNLHQTDKIHTKKLDDGAEMNDLVSSSSSKDCTEDSNSFSSDNEFDTEVTRIVESRKSVKKPLTETLSFLESLSAQVPLSKCDVAAKIFRTSYKAYRDELVKKLFNLYNDKVFGNIIPSDTAINWNDKLRGTAGLCHCKRITHRNGNVGRFVSISLSSKVLDSPDRLRDTLIHEMCHAAVWIVNMVSNGHGPYWKNWALHAMRTFPELPPIKRCHSYVINTKYTYKCTGCGQSIGRHSKSLNIERKRCGYCRSKFEILINKTTKNGVTKTVPVTPKREPSQFALFVKENYATYKEPSRKHGDVMKILGQKFAELKVQTS